MESNTIGAQLVKSISFEVEALPQDNAMEINNAGNMTPLNVKVKVRKKEDGPSIVKKGVLTVPRSDQPDSPFERVRLANSDQTIMSFNMLMEADLEKKVTKKPRRNFFGICLGVQGEDEDGQYMPSPSTDNKDINSRSDSGIAKIKHIQPLGKVTAADDTSTSNMPRRKDKLFGKCKPGGCLDPPFGEDRYAYQPHLKALRAPATKSIVSEDVGVVGKHDTKSSDKIGGKKRKETETSSAIKVSNKDDAKSNSILSLYKGEPTATLEDNDSDSIITYPPALSSSGLLLLGDDKTEKNVARRTSGARQSRKSFNEFNATYFSPPRTPRDSKESPKSDKRKSSLTKGELISNNSKPVSPTAFRHSIELEKDDKKSSSKSTRHGSNVSTGVTFSTENKIQPLQKDFDGENSEESAGLTHLKTATAGLTGLGVAMAMLGGNNKSQGGEQQQTKGEQQLERPYSEDMAKNEDMNRKTSQSSGLMNHISPSENKVFVDTTNGTFSGVKEKKGEKLEIASIEAGAEQKLPIVRQRNGNIKNEISHSGSKEYENHILGQGYQETNNNILPVRRGTTDFAEALQTDQGHKENNTMGGYRETDEKTLKTGNSHAEDRKYGNMNEGIPSTEEDHKGVTTKGTLVTGKGTLGLGPKFEGSDGNIEHSARQQAATDKSASHAGQGYMQSDQNLTRSSNSRLGQGKGESDENLTHSSTSRLNENYGLRRGLEHGGRDDDTSYKGRDYGASDEDGSRGGRKYSTSDVNNSRMGREYGTKNDDGPHKGHEFGVSDDNSSRKGQEYGASDDDDFHTGREYGATDDDGTCIGRENVPRDDDGLHKGQEYDASDEDGSRRGREYYEIGDDALRKGQGLVEIDEGSALMGQYFDVSEEFGPLGLDGATDESTSRNRDGYGMHDKGTPHSGLEYGSSDENDPYFIRNYSDNDENVSPMGMQYKITERKSAETRDASVLSDIIKNPADIISDYRKNKSLVKSPVNTMVVQPIDDIMKNLQYLKDKYDNASQSDISANDNDGTNRTGDRRQDERYGTQRSNQSKDSIPGQPSDQSRDSIFLNFAFQTHLDQNQPTIRTINSGNDPDANNIVIIKTLIKSQGKGVAVPISSNHIMNIEIKPAPPNDRKSKITKHSFKFGSGKYDYSSTTVSVKGISSNPQAALSVVLNQELVPLQAVIKNLKEDIDSLAEQQMMLRDRLAVKRIKPYSKKCGCMKRTLYKCE